MTFLSITVTIVTLAILNPLKEGIKSYSVRKITGDLDLSGSGRDPRWSNTKAVSDFSYPWEKETAPSTKFRALHNDQWVYCLFDVADDHVRVFQEKNDKSEVASSSRAEIFFRIDEMMNPYYCLEIDPTGRVLDYKATYHRNFDLGWSWPTGELVVRTAIRKDGYTVEVAVSKASLKELGLLNNNVLQAGLFRADCFQTKRKEPDFKWISWVTPDAPTPDFHIPSSFGLLMLED